MADEKDRINKESLKAVDDYIKKTSAAKDNLESMNKLWNTMSTEIFGISGAAFFKEVPKTTEELKAQRKVVSELKNDLDKTWQNIGSDLSKQFGDAFSSLEQGAKKFDMSPWKKSFSSILKDSQGINVNMSDLDGVEQQLIKAGKENTKEFQDFKKLKEEFIESEKNYKDEQEDFYKKILKDNPQLLSDLSERERIEKIRIIHQQGWNNLAAEGSDIVKEVAIFSDGVSQSIQEQVRHAGELGDKFSEASKEAQSLNKNALSVGNTIKAMASNIGSQIVPRMLEFDQAISDAGRDFGFVDAKSVQTTKNMAALGQSAARFGMSMGQALEMMGGLGDELNTINQDYLAQSVQEFTAIEKAIGISSQEITTVAGEMMRTGESAKDVKQFMEGSNKMAKMFGVNTKKVMQGVAKNLKQFNNMGFSGGEESLVRMIASAERLNMNVDDVFNMTKKGRSIEGAMEMASELQLAGGSFANIDPMSLLSAARKGPDEMRKILSEMGSDIGKINKDGTFEIDPIDADRLQIAADAAGVEVETLKNSIQKNAETAYKSKFLPDQLDMGEIMGPDGKPFDQESLNNMIADSVDMDGVVMEGSLLDKAGIKDVKNMTADQARNAIIDYQNKQKSIEEQAEANQSFEESIKAFKDAILNLFTVFEPVLSVLTSFVQMINGMPGPIKLLVAGLVGFAMIAPKLIGGFQSFKEGVSSIAGSFKGFMEGKGLKGKIKGALGMGEVEEGVKGGDSKDKTPGKSGGGLKTLADGLAAMGGKDVLKGIANTALAAPALVLMLAGIPTLLLMAGIGAIGKLVEAGFRATANGISAMGEAKGVLKGALAMLIIGAALIPFAFALQMMSSVEWSAIGIMVVGIIALAGIVALLGFIAPLMLAGSLALAAASVGLLIFGAAIMVFATASQMMQGMSFDWLGDLGWNLLIAAPGLLLGGLSLLMAAPALMIGGIALMAFATAAQTITGVDWAAFSTMGDALMSVVPGLLGFSLAGLMFINPMMLLGMALMMATLAGLAMVMVPLGAAFMMAGEGIDRFAQGLQKLQEVASNLDFERLEALKELSMGMALAGVGGGALGDTINKIAEALAKLTGGGGGSGGGGGTQKIQIDLKLNGRDLQSIIVDDTSIVS